MLGILYEAMKLKQEDRTLPWFLAIRTAEAKLRQLDQIRALGFI